MTDRLDLIVLGAGPAGAAAATEAAALGLRTMVIDENHDAGGQVYRRPRGQDGGPGSDLRATLHRSGAQQMFGQRCWHVERGFAVHLTGETNSTISADALIVATGARERILPVAGWTLPGAMGLAAATILLKSQQVLPGRRVVVAGRGPLLMLVASLIVKGGGQVAAMVDANGPGAWAARLPAMLSRPDLVLQGGGWAARLLGNRVPVYFNARLGRIHGEAGVTGVEIVHNRSDRRTHIDCDAVCHGDGLTPSTEVTRLLGATHRYTADRGGWHVVTDERCETDVPSLYAIGDGAGVLGAAAAPLQGMIAGIAAAYRAGRISHGDCTRRVARLRRRHDRAARFGAAMTTLTTPEPGRVAEIEDTVLLCRCENVSAGVLRAALDAGAPSPNALKSATRAGMGPCGGRYCGDSLAALVAGHLGTDIALVPPLTARPPLRPLDIAPLVEGFDYDTIPMPAPAPL